MPKPRGSGLIRPFLDERHQVGGMVERVVFADVVRQVLRWVAAEGQDVFHARLGIPVQDRSQFLPRMAHTGQMRDGGQLGFSDDLHHQLVRTFAGRSAGPVGHRNERWLQRLQAGDVLEQLRRRLVGLRRKELEAERRRVVPENILYVHGSPVMEFVPDTIRNPGARSSRKLSLRRAGPNSLT